VTKEFESQKEKITHSDMTQSALVCQALNGILFFNGGDASGSSQAHKHLQILPNQAYELPIFKEIYEFVTGEPRVEGQNILKFSKFNFLHGIVPVSPQ
jgi:ATP adenylyltransferase